MENNNSFHKIIIKTLLISKPNQKLRFQIRHPENAERIIGLATSCSHFAQSVFDLAKGSTVGYLTLSIAEKGDLAFGQDVKWDKNEYQDITEKNCRALHGNTLSKIGTRQSYFETDLEITKAVMEGFYEDVFLGPITLEINDGVVTYQSPVPNPFGFVENEVPLIPTDPVPIIPPTGEILPYRINIYIKYLISEKQKSES